MNKRRAGDEEGYMTEHVHMGSYTTKRKLCDDDSSNTRCREFRKASLEEEYAHRSRIDHQQMALILENFRKEKSDIIQQAGGEITRLKKEKEDVIRQSAGEITRLRMELDGCKKVAERVGLHIRKQEEVIEYLRRALSSSESSGAFLDPVNHVGAF